MNKPLRPRVSALNLLILLALSACSAPPTPSPSPPPSATPTVTLTASATVTPSATSTRTPIPSATPTPTITATPPPSDTPTITPTPTAVILPAIVNTPAQCRYGPGRAYLYKLGLEVGDALLVTGRNNKGTWAYVTPPDRNFPCWVSADLLDIQGAIASTPFHYIWLPKSPFYGPLRNLRAAGGGGEVSLSWDPFTPRPGDFVDNRYLVEAYVCVDGELELKAMATDEPFITFEDGSGCAQSPHALVYGVEKHGYTPPVSVSWR